jgi:hypothetical protein
VFAMRGNVGVVGFGGTGFSLSSCVHWVRWGAKAKIVRIAAWQRRTGRSACATGRLCCCIRDARKR